MFFGAAEPGNMQRAASFPKSAGLISCFQMQMWLWSARINSLLSLLVLSMISVTDTPHGELL